MTQRPNILCLVSEDCPPWLGAYGDQHAATPNIDRLAREGITYDAAFCTSPVCAPSRFAILTGCHAESCGPAHHMTASAHWSAELLTCPEVLRAQGYYCTNNSKTHYNCDIDPHAIWHESSSKAHWRNRPAGAPFMAIFNTMLTHESCMFDQHSGAVKPDDVTPPAYLPDSEAMREVMASYYNRIAEMDRYMGERLHELEEDGLLDDTIILYYSDHGSPLPRSKRFCYDEGLRVPLIARIPAKWQHLSPHQAGSRVASPVSLIDLFPTIAALVGTGVPDSVQGQPFLGASVQPRNFAFSGRNRMDERNDMVRTLRSARFRYIRNYDPHRIWGQHYAFAWEGAGYQDYERRYLAGTLSPEQKRFWQTKPAEELYNLADDPDEVHNLADDPAHAEMLIAMRQGLDDYLIRINDNGFIPEGMAPQGWHQSRAPGRYPLPQVLKLAGQAISRDPSNLENFLKYLTDPEPVLRYWAAQGVLMLATEGHDLPTEVSSIFESEQDLHIRISLAEALGQADPEPHIRFLTQIVAGTALPRLRLRAIEALTWLPPHPQISLAAVTAAANDSDEYIRGAAEYLRLKLTDEYRPNSPVFRFDMPLSHGHSGLEVIAPAPKHRVQGSLSGNGIGR
ncbi:sulfatase-like hydrolase/transferase [Paracoccus aerodenitrificans]|uniref:sulfatase-like hydrolase/transferase n=1 Tax=Paracoccus aerodenitrificans TaxID=3017781 RepID=UPI0022F02FD5|nr:sulfatase-like hydrolase/transferase [Paracoccus aerodenitrificans]WBU63906.1 sulfatase-like hydrolase/transferase [Paracoccus aerodenitrificans]